MENTIIYKGINTEKVNPHNKKVVSLPFLSRETQCHIIRTETFFKSNNRIIFDLLKNYFTMYKNSDLTSRETIIKVDRHMVGYLSICHSLKHRLRKTVYQSFGSVSYYILYK